MSSSGNLQAVVEQLTRFRSEVRAFALTRQDSQDKKSDLSPDRIPLLKSCDTLRKDLAPLGVVIKVSFVSIWCIQNLAVATICEYLRPALKS